MLLYTSRANEKKSAARLPFFALPKQSYLPKILRRIVNEKISRAAPTTPLPKSSFGSLPWSFRVYTVKRPDRRLQKIAR
jgi:hypothetical protein